jgi:hypothetical protein
MVVRTKYEQNKPLFCEILILFWITTRMEREKILFKKIVFIYPTKCYSTCYWGLENLNLERMADSGDDFYDVLRISIIYVVYVLFVF